MNDEWNNIKDKKKEKKKKSPLNKNNLEEIFFLSNLLCDGACIRCMNKSCKINEDHGIPFPEKIGVFVQNPSYIPGMDKVFNDAEIDFNGKKPFYTICNYINGNCRNCQEGRIKYIKYHDENIAVCYPNLDNIRNKITIGVHADIKLIMKGNKFESSIIPVEIIFEEENFDKDESTNEVLIEEWPVLNNYKKDNIQSEITNNFDNSFLNALKLNSDDNELENRPELANINENYDKDCNNNDIYYEKKNKNFENNFDYYYYSLEERNHFLEKEVSRLTNIISSQEEKNFSLEEKIKSLEKKIDYDKVLFKYGDKYDEILYNLNNLNNRVSDQFFESNYSNYILL